MKRLTLHLILPLAIGAVSPAMAEPMHQRTELAELVHELDFLTHRVAQLAAEPSDTGRVRFRYGALQADLQRIRDGINRYLAAASRAPNRLQPITGDYLEDTQEDAP
ncbi:MAG TPA: hypothetical protein ENK05_09615 [Gammaproteobacteria bacterium]|nr:hypothetical protein [Gammaproteobacteria bacterium]